MSERFHRGVVLALGGAVVVLHALGAGPLVGTLWGTHAYAFLPGWALPVAAMALAAVAVWCLQPPPTRRSERKRPERHFHPVLLWTGTGLVALILFWVFRSRALFLGDGLVLTRNLGVVDALHPREPLTSLIHGRFFEFTAGWFAAPGRLPEEVASEAVAVTSVLAGLAFIAIAWGLAGEILRLRSAEEQPSIGLRATVAALIAAQGYVQLFFGYVENYTFLAVGIALFLFAALRWLRGAAPLWWSAVALVLTIGFHLSAAALAVPFLVLVAWGLWRPDRRAGTLAAVVVTAAAFAALAAALEALRPGYRLDQEILTVGRGGMSGMEYMLSPEHLRDFFSEQMLIGPYALFWFLPLIVAAAVRRTGGAVAVFFGVAGLTLGFAHWMVPDLSLGYARDWDLFAPAAIVFTAAAAVLLATGLQGHALQRMATLVLAVSLFHTVPWIVVNASETRAIERFKTLPLGRGRTESTVGYWYALKGDIAQSRRWLIRAIEVNPANVRAHLHLANQYLTEGQADIAVRGFRVALNLQPHRSDLRESLVRGLMAAGRLDEAVAETRILTQQSTDQARAWAMHGVLLLGVVEPDSARAALDRAIELRPDRDDYRSARRKVDEPDGFVKILDEEWATIVRW